MIYFYSIDYFLFLLWFASCFTYFYFKVYFLFLLWFVYFNSIDDFFFLLRFAFLIHRYATNRKKFVKFGCFNNPTILYNQQHYILQGKYNNYKDINAYLKTYNNYKGYARLSFAICFYRKISKGYSNITGY